MNHFLLFSYLKLFLRERNREQFTNDAPFSFQRGEDVGVEGGARTCTSDRRPATSAASSPATTNAPPPNSTPGSVWFPQHRGRASPHPQRHRYGPPPPSVRPSPPHHYSHDYPSVPQCTLTPPPRAPQPSERPPTCRVNTSPQVSTSSSLQYLAPPPFRSPTRRHLGPPRAWRHKPPAPTIKVPQLPSLSENTRRLPRGLRQHLQESLQRLRQVAPSRSREGEENIERKEKRSESQEGREASEESVITRTSSEAERESFENEKDGRIGEDAAPTPDPPKEDRPGQGRSQG